MSGLKRVAMFEKKASIAEQTEESAEPDIDDHHKASIAERTEESAELAAAVAGGTEKVKKAEMTQPVETLSAEEELWRRQRRRTVPL